MDWSVGDFLISREITWRLKYENILEPELARLPDKRKGRALFRWSGNQGLGVYQVWCLDPSDILKYT